MSTSRCMMEACLQKKEEKKRRSKERGSIYLESKGGDG